jgi:hypothetical protein
MMLKNRHSGAGRNPAKNAIRAADKNERLTRFAGLFDCLDSGLRRNDAVFSCGGV